MNKTHQELCDENLQLREQLDAAKASTNLARLATRQAMAKAEELERERDGLVITLQAFGELVPTHYDDRDELFCALLRIMRTVPQGRPCRMKALALRDYANSLHPDHAVRPHLMSEVERLNKLADQQNRGGEA